MNEMLLGNYRVFGWACLAPKRQEITKKVDWEDSFLVSSQEDVMRLLHGFILGSLEQVVILTLTNITSKKGTCTL